MPHLGPFQQIVVIVGVMYVLGEDTDFNGVIIELLNEPSDADGFLIADVSSIRSRRSILYAPKTICPETVRRLAMIANKEAKLIFVKKVWAAEDIDSINSIIDEVKSSRTEIWKGEIKKLGLMHECAPRNERIEQLKSWIDTSLQAHSFLSFSETTFKWSVLSLLHRSRGFRFVEPPAPSLTNKPPALHWSNFPREDELQITFKFVFPLECLLNEELEELTKEATAVRQWQYSYEWSHGLLLRHDAVRIGIAQHGDSILEVSGRVDIADVEEDSEDTPMRLVWPYLSIVINVVLKYLNKISITFQLYILPIGDLFYENTVIKARSFDLTQFLISVNFRQLVEFQSDGQVCSVRLRSVLIDIQPKTLNDLTSIRPKETAKKSDFCTESLSPHHLSIERIAQHRGRRVSFGAIRCIPQPEPVDENKDAHQENAVDEFVDRFLGETMEQVLIR